jgi:hypothetical protein
MLQDVRPFFERDPNMKTKKVLSEIEKHLDIVRNIADKKVGTSLSKTDVSLLD